MRLKNIAFRTVTKSDIDFLYDLFQERLNYAKDLRFTKDEIPTFEQHKQFVVDFISGNGYQSWHIILLNNEPVGSLVLKKDSEWGYHVLIKHWGKKIGQSALEYLIQQNPNKTLIAKIRPSNKIACHIAEKYGHKLNHLVYVRKPIRSNVK